MRRLVALGVAFSSIFLLQGTAWAAHGDIQNISVDPTAVLLNDGSVRITGSITCTAGPPQAQWRVGARLYQDGDTSRGGPDIGTCNGMPQPWTVFVFPGFGDDYTSGSGNVVASAQTGDATSTVIERAETTEPVNIIDGSSF